MSRDGTEIADQSGTTLAVNGLAPDTTYAFAVKAYDAAGNVSTSLSLAVTTLPEPVAENPPPEEENPPPAEEPVPKTPAPTADEACPADQLLTFTDIAGNAHRDAIECTAWHGIAQGTSTTTYSPSQGVRRDQMAAFIARLLTTAGIDLPGVDTSTFTDIAGNRHAQAIAQLAELGVVNGVTSTTHAPSAPVRRDQMASFLVRALAHTSGLLTGGTTPFTDIAGNTHADSIAAVYQGDIARETSATTYAPGQVVRRHQMALFLTRALDRLVAQRHTVSGPAS